MKKVDLSIQLVNFNTAEYLMDCLKAISNNLKGSELSFEINILDNNSPDKFFRDFNNLKSFLDFLSEIGIRKKTSIYFSNKNLGYRDGHNFLAKKAYGVEFLLLLNTDILIQEKGAIEKLLCQKRKRESIFSWISGGVILIKKSTFEKIGGFEEKFFLCKKEEDLSLHIKRQDEDSKTRYYPEVEICHIG